MSLIERDDRRWVCDECGQMVALGPGEGWHYVDGERCPGEPVEYTAVATYAGAVEALREVERLLDHADLRAIPDVMNALDAARAAIPGGQ